MILKDTSKKVLEVSLAAWMHPHFWGEMSQNGEKAGFSPDFLEGLLNQGGKPA